jgi:DNA-binding transcriptional ArsR family regulator
MPQPPAERDSPQVSQTANDLCEQRVVHLDAVKDARSCIVSVDAAARTAEFLTMLGDTSRLRILSALSGRELCVCDIAASVELSESATSHQLRILRHMNLVQFRKSGRIAYYSLTNDSISSLCLDVSSMLQGLNAKPRQVGGRSAASLDSAQVKRPRKRG